MGYGQFALYILLLLYIYGAGTLTSALINRSVFPATNVAAALGLLVIVVGFLKDFFPAYQHYTVSFPKYLPINTSKRIIIDLIDSILRPVPLFLIFFLTILCIHTQLEVFDLGFQLLLLLFTVLTSINVRLSFTLQALYGLLHQAVALLSLGFAGILMVASLDAGPSTFVVLQVLALLIIAIAQRASLQKSYSFSKGRHRISRYSQQASLQVILIKGYFAQKKVRTALLIAGLVKVLLLSVNLFELDQKGTYVFDSELLFYLALSPAVLFTYVHNNLYGYLPQLWLIMARAADVKGYVLLQLRMVLIPLLADLAVSGILLLAFRQFKPEYISFYLLCAVGFMINSVIAALILPQPVSKNLFSGFMKSGTSIIASAIMFLVLSLVLKNMLWGLLAVVVLECWVLFSLLLKVGRSNFLNSRMYAALFSGK